MRRFWALFLLGWLPLASASTNESDPYESKFNESLDSSPPPPDDSYLNESSYESETMGEEPSGGNETVGDSGGGTEGFNETALDSELDTSLPPLDDAFLAPDPLEGKAEEAPLSSPSSIPSPLPLLALLGAALVGRRGPPSDGLK